MSGIPAGTPYMGNAEVVIDASNPPDPELCPVCLHVTLYTFAVTVLHDEGAVDCGTATACGSEECSPDE